MMLRRKCFAGVVALVALSGCLYLDGINSPPEVSMELQTDQDLVYVGEEVWVSALDTRDPDGDALEFAFVIEHSGSADSPQATLCPVYMQPGELCFIPGAKVTYTVAVQVTDSRGAMSESSLEVHVNNRPPEADCRIDTYAKPNGHYIVDREIWMTGVGSSDPDTGDQLYYHWEERSRPSSSVTADFVFQPSEPSGAPATEEASAVQLLVVPDVPGSYEVGLRVADEPGDANLSEVCQLFFEVDPDGEPCITSLSPNYATGTLVFDLFDLRRLEVTQVTDDLDPYPGGASGETDFRWLIEETPGAGFVEIPGYGFPYLDVDGTQFALNQRIRVRVVALDRATHDLSACPVELATCALSAGCFQWITWDIEFR